MSLNGMPPTTLQIATVGIYANERINHVTTRRPVDKIHLICTEANMPDVQSIISHYETERIPVTYSCVQPWSYAETLAEVLDVVMQNPGCDIEFNISCGTTGMRAACHMAAVLIEAPVHYVGEKPDDVVGSLITVQPLTTSKLTEPKKKILTVLIDNGGRVESQADLGSRTNLGAASISKHIKELVRLGLVEKVLLGGKNSIRATTLGKVILRLRTARAYRRRSRGQIGDR